MENTFSIGSSHGELLADKTSGTVTSCDLYKDGDTSIKDIRTIDVQEWQKTYGRDMDNYVDILDVGYWYEENGETKYEGPTNDWRVETGRVDWDTLLMLLWKKFGDVLVTSDDEIEEEFKVEWKGEEYAWPAGSDKSEIWHWFDENHSVGLWKLMELG